MMHAVRGMLRKNSVEVTNGETDRLPHTRTAAVLVEKLKEFRQSYNRTHGQVCEFFEQAHIIEKIYHHSPGPSKTATAIAKHEDKPEDSDNDEEEGCNEQKTWSIKQKLNSWRAVMREVVCDVCPNLQLENQPDINPGLMKHVLDEIRKLKTELAFQHNTILELTHQLENHQSKNQRKDRLIEKLLHRSREIRLEGHHHNHHSHPQPHQSEQRRIVFGPEASEECLRQSQHLIDSFDQDDFRMFGNLDDFSFDLQDLVSHYLWETDEKRGKDSVDARQGSPASHQPATASIDAVHDLNSHCLASESETVKSHESVDINKEEAVDSTNNDAPRNSEISEIDRAASPLDSRIPPASVDASARNARWKNHRAMLGVCGRLGCVVYVACKVMQKSGTGKQ